jgi:hypothetical protein
MDSFGRPGPRHGSRQTGIAHPSLVEQRAQSGIPSRHDALSVVGTTLTVAGSADTCLVDKTLRDE